MENTPSDQPIYSQADLQAKKDNDHIRILAICHYVMGGLALLTSLIAIIYIVIGIVMLTGAAFTRPNPPATSASTLRPPVVEADLIQEIHDHAETVAESSEEVRVRRHTDAMPAVSHSHGHAGPASSDMTAAGVGVIGILFVIGGVLFFLFMVVSGLVQILSGRFMVKRKNRVFSLIIAGLNLMSVPLGTILGIFTLIVLLRPSVTAEYEAAKRAMADAGITNA